MVGIFKLGLAINSVINHRAYPWHRHRPSASSGRSLPILQRRDAFRGRPSSLGDDGRGAC